MIAPLQHDPHAILEDENEAITRARADVANSLLPKIPTDGVEPISSVRAWGAVAWAVCVLLAYLYV